MAQVARQPSIEVTYTSARQGYRANCPQVSSAIVRSDGQFDMFAVRSFECSSRLKDYCLMFPWGYSGDWVALGFFLLEYSVKGVQKKMAELISKLQFRISMAAAKFFMELSM